MDTPMMRQYLSIKQAYPDEILFFRMGDFYEMFLDDAIYASRVLDIALTKRGDKIPMCGIPHHSWQNYVLKIIQSGKNVAVCEQTEDPKKSRNKLVQRQVIRVLTPGSVFEEELLDHTSRALLSSLYPIDEKRVSVALVDLSTGEVSLEIVLMDGIEDFLFFRGVREILSDKKFSDQLNIRKLSHKKRDFAHNQRNTEKILLKYFKVNNVNVLELSEIEACNLSNLFRYIEEVASFLSIKWQKPVKEYQKKKMVLDDIALRTLEVLQDQEHQEEASLMGVLDHTKTSGGKRLLKDFLVGPSLDQQEIEERYDIVDFLIRNPKVKESLTTLIKKIRDISRLTNYLNYSPKVYHFGHLYISLKNIRQMVSVFKDFTKSLPERLKKLWLEQKFPEQLLNTLEMSLVLEDLPPLLDERRFVKPGFSRELDEIFFLSESIHKILAEYEKNERNKYGVNTLKVRYNKVIGYYIEISKGLASKAPPHYIRRQTFTTGERFTTKELEELGSKILNSQENIINKQKEIFEWLRQQTLDYVDTLRNWSHNVSYLDVMLSFAESAVVNRYTRPELDTTGKLKLIASRHPVVEHLFKRENFVPNDADLNLYDRHLAILTGPNMSGKSTYIRQIGLIQIMAQVGSFVPATKARISLVDRVFTRIGAYDRLHKGESTFYVEMSECAKIFQHYTKDSLILLDEVGRGTSTFDGVSIARAMLEHLNSQREQKPKILFATHFTELSEMIDPQKGICGFTVQVLEENDKITFLRKIKEGVASKSYGIYVAKLAGVPEEVIQRANEIISSLEQKGLKIPVKESQEEHIPSLIYTSGDSSAPVRDKYPSKEVLPEHEQQLMFS